MSFDPYKPPQSEADDVPAASGFRPTYAGLIATIFIAVGVGLETAAAALDHVSLSPGMLDKASETARSVGSGFRLVGAVAFLVWIHRIVANAIDFGGASLVRTTPGRAVGFWFVPLLNLVHGYRVVSGAWQASDPERGRDRPPAAIILHWWLAYMASRVAVIACRVSWSTAASLFALLFEVTAVVLMGLVIRRLDQRQRARALSR